MDATPQHLLPLLSLPGSEKKQEQLKRKKSFPTLRLIPSSSSVCPLVASSRSSSSAPMMHIAKKRPRAAADAEDRKQRAGGAHKAPPRDAFLAR